MNNWREWFQLKDAEVLSGKIPPFMNEERRYQAFKARMMEELQIVEAKPFTSIPYGFGEITGGKR